VTAASSGAFDRESSRHTPLLLLLPAPVPTSRRLLLAQANNMAINSKTEQVFLSGYDKQKGGSVVFELDWANGTLTEVVVVPGQVQNNLCAFAPQTNSFILVGAGSRPGMSVLVTDAGT
jgi:hypothetical protein